MDIFAIKESAELGLRVSGRALGNPGIRLWSPQSFFFLLNHGLFILHALMFFLYVWVCEGVGSP